MTKQSDEADFQVPLPTVDNSGPPQGRESGRIGLNLEMSAAMHIRQVCVENAITMHDFFRFSINEGLKAYGARPIKWPAGRRKTKADTGGPA